MIELDQLHNKASSIENCLKISCLLRQKSISLGLTSDILEEMTRIKRSRIEEIFKDCYTSKVKSEEIFLLFKSLGLTFNVY